MIVTTILLDHYDTYSHFEITMAHQPHPDCILSAQEPIHDRPSREGLCDEVSSERTRDGYAVRGHADRHWGSGVAHSGVLQNSQPVNRFFRTLWVHRGCGSVSRPTVRPGHACSQR